MSDENNKPKTLSLSGSGKLSLGGTLDSSSLRGGDAGPRRGKTVRVEVRRKRVPGVARPGCTTSGRSGVKPLLRHRQLKPCALHHQKQIR